MRQFDLVPCVARDASGGSGSWLRRPGARNAEFHSANKTGTNGSCRPLSTHSRNSSPSFSKDALLAETREERLKDFGSTAGERGREARDVAEVCPGHLGCLSSRRRDIE